MTVLANSTKNLLPFDQEYSLFPESCPEAVFANDIALLITFAMNLPSGPVRSAAGRKQAADNASICIQQFIETDQRAHAARLLSDTDTATMIFLNLSYVMMGKLVPLIEAELIPQAEWEAVKTAYGRLAGSLNAMNHLEY